MNNFKKIGEFIKSKREENNLSQDTLAEKLGVSKATISLYESGDRKPSLKRLSELAKILETPLSNFLALDTPVDIELALRAEGMSNEDIERIKAYIKFVKDAQKEESKN